MSSAATVGVASAQARLQTPPIDLTPAAVLRQTQSGTMAVEFPFPAAAAEGLGPVSVRPGTFLRFELALRDGQLDFGKTRIGFVNEDGSATTLDGPLFFNPSEIYIDDEGKLRARVPLIGDPNLTSAFFGEGVERIPNDPVAALRLLATNPRFGSQATQVLGFLESQGVPLDTPVPLVDGQTLDVGTQGAAITSARERTRTATSPSAAQGLRALAEGLNSYRVRVTADGVLAPGTLPLGEGTQVVLREPGRFSLRGDLSELRAEVQAPLQQLTLTQGESRITTGQGNATLTVGIAEQGGTRQRVDVGLPALDVQDVVIQAGEQNLRFGRLRLNAPADAPPAISVQRVTEADLSRHSDLRLNLQNVEVEDLEAAVAVNGADGKPATLTIGNAQNPNAAATTGRGTITYAPGAGFNVDLQTENLEAVMQDLSLVRSQPLNVDLSSAVLRGSGRMQLNNGTLALTAAPNTTWAIDGALRDGRLDMAEAGTIDLGEGSQARLRLTELAMGAQPRLQGTAELDVGFDQVDLPALAGSRLTVGAGARAQVRLDSLSQQPGDRTPSFTGEVRASLGTTGANLTLPSALGVRVEQNPTNGDRTVVARIGMTNDGVVSAQSDVSLPRVNVDYQAPTTPPASPVASTPTSPLATAPSLALTGLDPTQAVASVLRGVDDANVAVTVPMQAVSNLRVLQQTGNPRVTVDLSREAGPITLQVGVVDGEVDPAQSRIAFNPPLNLSIDWGYRLFGFIPFGGVEAVAVHGLEIRRDPYSGKGVLAPILSFNGELATNQQLGLVQGLIQGQIGSVLSQQLFGGQYFSLDLDTMLAFGLQRAQQSNGAAMPPAVAQLSSALRLDQTEINVDRCAFEPTTLDLGGGQTIGLRPGSQLSVRGTATEFTVEGTAVLGPTRLTSAAGALGLDSGRADVRLHVVNSPNGGLPRIEAALTNLQAEAFFANGTFGGPQVGLRDVRLTSGSVNAVVQNGQVQNLSLRLPTGVTGAVQVEGQIPR